MGDRAGLLAGFCVVANVAEETASGEGGLEVRAGARHFAAGAKVWVLPPQWGDGGDQVIVAGHHRGTRGRRGLARMVMPRRHLTGFRVQGVYSPAVIRALTRPLTELGLEHAPRLYGQAYAAFRRRRSLLLLNLEHQVRFCELPWIAALQPFRADSADTARAARQALAEVAFLAVRGFPQTIVPNPLIAEMSALAAQAGLPLPLTEEVAADIFTGTFTTKWADAAAAASGLLDGTLYARYYDLPAPQAWPGGLAAMVSTRRGKTTAEGFTALCKSRASQAQASGGSGSRVAVNGTILEQSQILTTHNLAILIDALGLRDRVAGLASGLADRTFAWLIRSLQQRPPTWRAQLQGVKNAAYAWRQAIYFLSLCPPAAQAGALARLRGQVQAAGDEDFQARFQPVIDGLAHVVAGGRFDADGSAPDPGGGRRFLGWTAGRHWILDPATPSHTTRSASTQ